MENNPDKDISVLYERCFDTFDPLNEFVWKSFLHDLNNIESVFPNLYVEPCDIRRKNPRDILNIYLDFYYFQSNLLGFIKEDNFNYDSEIPRLIEKKYPELKRRTKEWINMYVAELLKKERLPLVIDPITILMIENESGITENLQNIEDKKLAKEIEDYFIEKIELNTNDFLTEKKEIDKYFLHFGVFMMDFYIISKIFSTNSENFILYTGDHHSDDYREFFDKLGFDVIQKFESYKYTQDYNIKDKYTDHQCIYISNYLDIFNM